MRQQRSGLTSRTQCMWLTGCLLQPGIRVGVRIYGGGDIFGGGDINHGTPGDIYGGIFGDVWGGNETIQYTPFVTTFSYDYWATETRQIQNPAEERSPASRPMGAGAQKDKRIAFVGGAADSTSEIVKGIYKQHGGPNDVYFEWTQGKELAAWIDANQGSELTVIGHSYGGNTAAGVVAGGHSVGTLITVDPVGMFRPNFSNVAKYSGTWTNYNSVGTGIKWSNFVATMGRAYNNAPRKFADSHHNVKLDHVGICLKHCVP